MSGLRLLFFSLIIGIAPWKIAIAEKVNEDSLAVVIEQYKGGHYRTALEVSGRLSNRALSAAERASLNYWSGLSHNKLQEYAPAAKDLRMAQEKGSVMKDLHYEEGQAHFALKSDSDATTAFQRSVDRGYLVWPSQYYLAYISQRKGDLTEAVSRYQKIIDDSHAPVDLKQSSYFQLGEIAFQSEKKEESLSFFKQAVELLPESALAKTISSKYFPSASGPFGAGISQALRYDSNVVLESDSGSVEVSGKNSSISKTTAIFLKLIGSDDFFITPTSVLNFDWHARRSESRVVQNDSLYLAMISPIGKSHSLGSLRSTLTIEPEVGYLLRNWDLSGLRFYQRHWAIGLAESVNFLQKEPTTLRFRFKQLTSSDLGYSANIPSFHVGQGLIFSEHLSTQMTLGSEFQLAQNSTHNLLTHRISVAMAAKELFSDVSALPSVTLSSIDTRNQQSTRGTETLVNILVPFSKRIFSSLNMTLSYEFLRRISKDKENYTYAKHVLGLQLDWNLY